MTFLVVCVLAVLAVSAFCSLSEAGLYAVRLPYVRVAAQSGSRAGRILLGFKHDVQRPIAAILILNTIANTAGATVAGAQARALFGDAVVPGFATFFTLAVLFLAETLPKAIGVSYNRFVAIAIAVPLRAIMVLLAPLLWLTQAVTRLVQRGPQPIASEDEVQQFAQMSAEEGSILPEEAALVNNVLRLNEVRAQDILTPRNVVFKLPATHTVHDLRDVVGTLPYSRIPIYDHDDPEHWTGVVNRRDLLQAFAENKTDVAVEPMAKPLHFVPSSMRGHTLLREFLGRREHLFGVVDEFGSVAGVVTLEDVLESLLGEEIVDETDTTVDLQAAARQRRGELLEDDGDSKTERD
jgi:CBS domain containing-hemolysin-like protein